MEKIEIKVPKALSFEKTENTGYQMLRYLITGIIVQGIATGVLFILTEKLNLYYFVL